MKIWVFLMNDNILILFCKKILIGKDQLRAVDKIFVACIGPITYIANCNCAII
jgi:hypothetical protein